MSSINEDKETKVYFGILLGIEKKCELNHAELVPYEKIQDISQDNDSTIITYEQGSEIIIETSFEPTREISLITLHHEIKTGSYITEKEYYYQEVLKETLINHYSGECLGKNTTLEEKIGQAPPPLPRK